MLPDKLVEALEELKEKEGIEDLDSYLEALITEFKPSDFGKYRGKIVVIDGTDGCGKRTLTALIAYVLDKYGINFFHRDYPVYESNVGGQALVRLLGKDPNDFTLGKLKNFMLTGQSIKPLIKHLYSQGLHEQVWPFLLKENFSAYDFLLALYSPYIDHQKNQDLTQSWDGLPFPFYIKPGSEPPFGIPPHIMAIAYGIDRSEDSMMLKNGVYISNNVGLLDRWRTSNQIHQTSKIVVRDSSGNIDLQATEAARLDFLKYLDDFEIALGVHTEDLVIALNTHISTGIQMNEMRGRKLDYVESDIVYQQLAIGIIPWLCEVKSHWRSVDVYSTDPATEKPTLRPPIDRLRDALTIMRDYRP